MFVSSISKQFKSFAASLAKNSQLAKSIKNSADSKIFLQSLNAMVPKYYAISNAFYPLPSRNFVTFKKFMTPQEIADHIQSVYDKSPMDYDYAAEVAMGLIGVFRFHKFGEELSVIYQSKQFTKLVLDIISQPNKVKAKVLGEILHFAVTRMHHINDLDLVVTFAMAEFQDAMHIDRTSLNNILIFIGDHYNINSDAFLSRQLNLIEEYFNKIKTNDIIFLMDNCNKILLDKRVLDIEIQGKSTQEYDEFEKKLTIFKNKLVPIVTAEGDIIEPARGLEAANMLLDITHSHETQLALNKLVQNSLQNHNTFNSHYLIMLCIVLQKMQYTDNEVWNKLYEDIEVRFYDFTMENLVTLVNLFIQIERGTTDIFESISKIFQENAEQLQLEILPALIWGMSQSGADIDSLLKKLETRIIKYTTDFSLEDQVRIFISYSQSRPSGFELRDKFLQILDQNFNKLNILMITDIAISLVAFQVTESEFALKCRDHLLKDIQEDDSVLLSHPKHCSEIFMSISAKGEFLFPLLPRLNQMIPDILKKAPTGREEMRYLIFFSQCYVRLKNKKLLELGEYTGNSIKYLHDKIGNFIKLNKDALGTTDYMKLNGLYIELKDLLRQYGVDYYEPSIFTTNPPPNGKND